MLQISTRRPEIWQHWDARTSARVESPFCDFMTYMTFTSIMNWLISLAPRRNDPKAYVTSLVDREAMLRRRIIPWREGANWPRFETQIIYCCSAFSWSYLEILQVVWDSARLEMSTESRFFTWYAPNLDMKTRDETNWIWVNNSSRNGCYAKKHASEQEERLAKDGPHVSKGRDGTP